MRLALAFLLFAGSLSAQARSGTRIPVRKQQPPPHVDTVRITVHDTVKVIVHDTVPLFKAAALPPQPQPMPPDSVKCSDRYIPIPIPFPRGHGSSGGSNTGGPVTATPEPQTLALLATGLVGLGVYKLRRRK